MTEHTLKLNIRYFDAVKWGIKSFEIRKDDRGFKVGDTIHLVEVDDEGQAAGRATDGVITYILHHQDFPDGIPEGYCVMSIKRTLA